MSSGSSSRRRSCVNQPDVFCYICGEYMFLKNRQTITDFVKRAYLEYFGVNLGDKGKNWAPHLVCKTFTDNLRQWTTGKRKCLKFDVPMVWRKPKNHFNDLISNVTRQYALSRTEIPILTFHQLPDISKDEYFPSDRCSDVNKSSDANETNSAYEETSSVPQRFNQNELNDLTRDLNLSKKASEVQ
ncbi:unnamed protein product [Psylliodes chrysocephalus]|uniref:Uncharacterized protein n=1 Tax=Psylliodes chrysocephalus TaxID=3402493 RepID=A0A9P0CFS3_9CUCU|nr:unnamed protein product [Psylliodes chrysocephala]